LPLQLPNLDDLRWNDLVVEGRSLIPSWAEEWTDHNPSDPGMTLIELFAYVSGIMMYQLNRITDSDNAEFLGLLNGPKWKETKGLAKRDSLSSSELRATLDIAVSNEEKRRTVTALSSRMRAVTSEDFESLTCAMHGVERAKCLPQRNLENHDPASRWMDAPGHVSVVVLPSSKASSAEELLGQVRQTLEPARLLTTRIHVVAARYVSVGVQISIVPERNVYAEEELRTAVVEKLAAFLDPVRGGFDGKGWPIGRALYLSELYQLVGEIRGIDRVTRSRDSQGELLDEITTEAPFLDRIVRNQNGEIQAITLLPDEFFAPRIEPRTIAITRRA
jgi:Baseplate J-like protein